VTPAFASELDFASALAREAGALLRRHFGEAQEIDFKGRIDLVTRMDHESERLIVGRIAERFPGDDVQAEEGHGASRGAERVWIVDPLDGTVNYAHEYPVWSVSIALQVAGRLQVGVVYNPLLDDLYAGRRGGGVTLNGMPRRVSACESMERALLATGFSYDLSGDHERNNLAPFGRFILRAQAVRRAGSAALAISKVAVGRTDGFWERNLHPWDMAAAALLVEEAGGRVSDYEGGDGWLAANQLVASNGRLHEEMLSVLRPPAADAGTEMRYYVMAFLRTGPNPPTDPQEKKRLLTAHLGNMEQLHAEGKLILAGPFKDGGDLEGIFLLNTESLEEARSWCDGDPAIASGDLRADLVKWYSAKGIGIYHPSTGEAPAARSAR
jgi:myo-inositol-1(or 4)-monophosphatase